MTDKEIKELIEKEDNRQQTQINLIPSENRCSQDVLDACGSVLNNKYAEGYPDKRYYQGNKIVDEVEKLAIKRALQLFKLNPEEWHVNVQPHSGASANLAVYNALLVPNSKVLGMNLNHGGHLTHGSPVNVSGQKYQFIAYGVEKESGKLDYDKIEKLCKEQQPAMIVCGYTAYPRKIDFKRFGDIAKKQENGAPILMADISHIAGLIAAGVHPSPFEYADVVTTTTHKTLRGPRSAIIFCRQKYAKAIDKAVFPGMQGGPHMHTIAGKATAFLEADTQEFKDYQKQIVINAAVLAGELMDNRISLVSNGTDTHLILIDLLETIGKEGEGKNIAEALEKIDIITNANTIPFDPSTPFKPSGLRIGTPFVTTQGLKQAEMKILGKIIADAIRSSRAILESKNDDILIKQFKERVNKLL